MDLAAVLSRAAAVRPRVAAELARPHAEEALLAEVVTMLLAAGALDALGAAFGLSGETERVVLWGADVATGADDLSLAGSLRTLAPSAGRAALLDAEPDLVVVTSTVVGTVDATVGRPGHAAARASRGEPMPPARLAQLTEVLLRHGAKIDAGRVATGYATAWLAAIALELGTALARRPTAIALAGHADDLLHPGRDDLAAWLDSARLVAAATATTGLELRGVSWLQVAERLELVAAARPAVRRIRAHPVLAATRRRIGS